MSSDHLEGQGQKSAKKMNQPNYGEIEIQIQINRKEESTNNVVFL